MTEAGALAARIFADGRFDALTEAGLDRVGVPESFGGVGGDLLDAVDVAMRAAEYGAPDSVADTLLVDGWLVTLAGAASPDDRRLRGAFARATQIAGALSRVLTMTVAYAGERHQFGRPIGRQQAVRHLVAGAAGEVAATVAAVAAATVALRALPPEGTGDALLPIAAAKVQAGRAATLVARAAHQVHGAIGTTREHPLHRYTTRLWRWRDEYGDEQYWAGRIGEALTERHDARSLWRAIAG